MRMTLFSSILEAEAAFRRTEVKQCGTCSSCYEQALRKTGIKKLSAFILSEGPMHLNAPKMNGCAGEWGCLKDK